VLIFKGTGMAQRKNLAEWKSTHQSSTFTSSAFPTGSAFKCVDNNRSPLYSQGGCCITAPNHAHFPHWWGVDLETPYNIQEVKIYNRADGWGHVLNNFNVILSNHAGWAPSPGFLPISEYVICAHYPGTAGEGEVFTFDCSHMAGTYQYVYILMITERYALNLCEVEVYGFSVLPVLPDCQHPGYIANGEVTATDNWTLDSYAVYSCHEGYIMEGPYMKQCVGSGDDEGWETPASKKTPTCIGECRDSIYEPECGSGGLPELCADLGCCYLESSQKCLHKPGKLYLNYNGMKPEAHPAFADLLYRTSESCAKECIIYIYNIFIRTHIIAVHIYQVRWLL
jgi:hypothetical protein